jgi:hypothetical protein
MVPLVLLLAWTVHLVSFVMVKDLYTPQATVLLDGIVLEGRHQTNHSPLLTTVTDHTVLVLEITLEGSVGQEVSVQLVLVIQHHAHQGATVVLMNCQVPVVSVLRDISVVVEIRLQILSMAAAHLVITVKMELQYQHLVLLVTSHLTMKILPSQIVSCVHQAPTAAV